MAESKSELVALQEPLSTEERKHLTDRSLSEATSGFSLAGRLVTDLTVSGLHWDGSWAGAHVERVTFRDCRFLGHLLGAATYRDVTFENCVFNRCDFSEGTLERCRFVACRWLAGATRGLSLQDCQFSNSSLSGVMFQAVRLDGVQMRGGDVRSVRLSECKIHLLELDTVNVESLRFTMCEAGRMAFTRCSVSRLAVLGGSLGAIEVAGGVFTDCSLAQAEVRFLRLSDIEQAPRFRINRSHLQDLSVARSVLPGLYWCGSEIEKLTLTGGCYDGWLTDCKVGGGSSISEAELAGFYWDGTEALGLTLSRVSLQRFFCARRARFVGLSLIGLSYGDQLKLVLGDARFEDSDRFAASEPSKGTP